jgi:hypothetical protein
MSATGAMRARTARARSAPSLSTTIPAVSSIAGHNVVAIVRDLSSASNGIPTAVSSASKSKARAAGKLRARRSARNSQPTPKAAKARTTGWTPGLPQQRALR